MITLENVSKRYFQEASQVSVLEDINLSIAEGEFVTIFGPNGCGKSTLLNIACGLENTDSGSVAINNKNPEHSKTGFVFQNYNESLFPWRTALENIAFAFEIQGIQKKEGLAKAEALLKQVGLLQHKDKYLYELSGGMKQLVAICRAIAYQPDTLLMDEPFSSLDYSTTRKMEMELLELWQERKLTTLFVSHDVDEAIILADRVVILSPRPAKIRKVVEIHLPRPRTLEMLTSNEFLELRNEVLQSFLYE